MVKKIKPKVGQESVWDYPRPPAIELCTKHIRVIFNGEELVSTNRSYRILETSHPPVYYLPLSAVNQKLLRESPQSSFCEWKGRAKYFDIVFKGKITKNAAWQYPKPTQAFEYIADCIAVYPSMMDACYVNDEKFEAQAGDFYGGWITKEIVGPFKGESGTWGW